MYNTFVRPKLEFAAAAWKPWQEGEVKTLEKVQERAIRLLSDARGSTCEEKLKDVGLTTLQERRVRGDMIEMFKTVKGVNRVDKREWFELEDENKRELRTNSTTSPDGNTITRRPFILKVEQARLEARRNFFTIRAAKEWNGLPDELKLAESENTFKNGYDNWKKKEQS